MNTITVTPQSFSWRLRLNRKRRDVVSATWALRERVRRRMRRAGYDVVSEARFELDWDPSLREGALYVCWDAAKLP